MRLFEITDAIELILAREVNHETGEITEETIAALDALEMQRDVKCLAVAAYLKGERAEAAAVKVEAEKLRLRADGHKRRADRLVEYLRDHFPEDAEKLSDARSVIQWRKNPPKVELDPAVELSKDCCRHQPETWVPDKKVIGAMLKVGGKVKGARLVQTKRLDVK